MKRDRTGDPPKTAADLMAELETDSEYVTRLQSQEQKRLQAVSESMRNAEPIVAELRKIGFAVETVGDLFNRKMEYEKSIPVLLKWLPRIADNHLKQDVIRALSVAWAKPQAAPILIQEYREAADTSGTGIKWVIANALSVVADDTVFSDVVTLLRDRQNGKSREMLALALGNMENPRAINVLTDLLQDEQVVGHAVIALGILRAKDARPLVEKLSKHPKAWIRREVFKALALIDSSSSKLT